MSTLLFQAVRETLFDLLADPQYLGGVFFLQRRRVREKSTN
jgi:hypothetical protein